MDTNKFIELLKEFKNTIYVYRVCPDKLLRCYKRRIKKSSIKIKGKLINIIPERIYFTNLDMIHLNRKGKGLAIVIDEDGNYLNVPESPLEKLEN